MRDVALAAGVSVKTVSNVVNGFAHVRPDTRARVQAQIEALRYRPQAVGRHLRQGRTGMVTLVVPEIDLPYFADLAARLVSAARLRGLTVLVEQTDGDLTREREAADGYPVRLADGLIFSPFSMSEKELAAARPGTPTVLLGEHGENAAVDRVGVDGVAVGAIATEHLLDVGRRRIAMVGRKPWLNPVMSQRARGYEAALRAADLPVDPALAPELGEWSRQVGEQAVQVLLDERRDLDGIFAANDLLALGALHALHRRGVRVPDDVAIVGVDDIPEASYAAPTLSTVAIDRAAIAERALDLLTSRLDDADLPPRTVLAPHRLVARESTANPTPLWRQHAVDTP